MGWYYRDNGRETGPLSKEEMQALVQSGRIVRDTQVRNENSTEWTTYGQLLEAAANRQGQAQAAQGEQQTPQASVSRSLGSGGGTCSECGGTFAEDELLSYQDARVCASCKPVFFQKLREGVAQTSYMDFAGFWTRFGAKFIDGIILAITNALMSAGAGVIMTPLAGAEADAAEMAPVAIGGMALLYILQIAVAAGYSSFFLGKYSATPGKMALGIRVVRSEGGRISYARGMARYFAEILSGMILAIGYIMAAFDSEKRALHDHICDTRVIRN